MANEPPRHAAKNAIPHIVEDEIPPGTGGEVLVVNF